MALLTQIQALDKDELVGVIVGKLEVHRGGPLRGYIAMLAVRESYRGHGIGSSAFSICPSPNDLTDCCSNKACSDGRQCHDKPRC